MRINFARKCSSLRQLFLVSIFVVIGVFPITRGFPLDYGRHLAELLSSSRAARQAMPEMLRGSFDLSAVCAPGIELTLGTKRLNVRNLQLNTEDAVSIRGIIKS